MSDSNLHRDSRLVQSYFSSPTGSRAAATPLYQTSMFTFDQLDTFTDAWNAPGSPHAYSRLSNPTTNALEDAVADLEEGTMAMATASGMGAISGVVLALLGTGDHVLVQRGVYGGTISLLEDLSMRWGLELSYVDGEDPDALATAIRPNSKLLYLETIANPLGQVCDLRSTVDVARRAGLWSMVDNTFATPLLCQPIRHGADVVVHSTTKYIAGHSDVIGGIAVFQDRDLFELIWRRASEFGASLDPFAAWLTLRGLQSLSVRLQRCCANAAALAQALTNHERVTQVHWAGLADHPSHLVAKDLLADFGGVVAFDIAGGLEAGREFCEHLRVARLAPSLGGVATTVLHPASTSHAGLTAQQLREAGIRPGTVRIAAGLEDATDLCRDVLDALGSQ